MTTVLATTVVATTLALTTALSSYERRCRCCGCAASIAASAVGPTAVHALRGVSFDVAAGTMVALVGRSGSGKTTLLNVIGGLDRPDAGTVLVDGTDVTGLDEDGLSRLRREKVAYVFQTFGLIPVLSAAENVGAPLRLARRPGRGAGTPGRAAAGARRPGRPRPSSARTSCPAGSSSGWPSPGRWPRRRGC